MAGRMKSHAKTMTKSKTGPGMGMVKPKKQIASIGASKGKYPMKKGVPMKSPKIKKMGKKTSVSSSG